MGGLDCQLQDRGGAAHGARVRVPDREPGHASARGAGLAATVWRLSYSAEQHEAMTVRCALALFPVRCFAFAAVVCSRSSESTRTTAPYGAWASPLDGRARHRAGRCASVTSPSTARTSTGRRAGPPRRANVVVRRTRDGRTLDVTPGRLQRALAGARVRRRRDGGAQAATFTSRTSRTSGCTGSRGGGDPTRSHRPAISTRTCAWTRRGRRLLAVREDHRQGDAEPPAAIVAVPRRRSEGERPGVVLVSGADFYSDPIVSPDGGTLAWLQWNHPNMPWDGTELWTAPFKADGTLGPRRKIAGGADESVFQPEWSPDGVLYFVSDRTGWWNLYRLSGGRTRRSAAPPIDRAAASDGGRVRQAAVDLLDGHLRLRRRAPHRRQLRAGRPLEARPSSRPTRCDGSPWRALST